MRQTTKRFTSAAGLAMLTASAFAQMVGHIGPQSDFQVVGKLTTAEEQKPAAEFRAIQERVNGAAYDPQADAILSAAEASTKSAFAFSQMVRRRAATYRTTFSGFMPWICGPKGDTLIVEWQVFGSLGNGTLLLEDEPCVSIYALRIGHIQVDSRAAINAVLEGIFGPQDPFTRATVSVDFMPPATRWLASRLMTSSTDGLANVDYKAVITAEDTFLVLTLGTGGYDNSYPVPPFIPERFAPLGEQVKTWDVARLWAELNHGELEHRGLLLLTEIFRRGGSGADFLRALDPGGDHVGLSARATVATWALVRAGKQNALPTYLDAALQRYEGVGPEAEQAASRLFWDPEKRCLPAVQEIAIRHLNGPFPAGPLGYLGRCSASADILVKLERMAVPDKYSIDRDSAIRAIRSRLKAR